MARPFSELSDPLRADPVQRARIERQTRELERRLRRPWWRLVQAWDRITRRHAHW